MNAQSNHPSNDTTDPQFLGPEAGQQAGGGNPHAERTGCQRLGAASLLLSCARRLDLGEVERRDSLSSGR